MAQVYNQQFGRMVQVDTPLMQRMARDNFTPQHTGGGCMTWERITDDDGYIWITDESGAGLGAWADRKGAGWIVGRYNSEGDFIDVEGVTLAQALKLADTLRAPVDGEQSVLSMADYREG